MRILHITTFLQGGAGRIIAALAAAQQRMGHAVHVVADAGRERGYGNYPEHVEMLSAAGVPLTFVRSTFTRDSVLNRFAADDVRSLIGDWPPDVVHAHAATPARVARLAGVCDGGSPARLVHTMHGWGVSKTPQQSADDLATLDDADGVSTPSYAAAGMLRTLGAQRADIRVIPYGLEPWTAAALPDAPDVQTIGPRVASPIALCIGTFGERKNQRLLVEALACDGMRDATAVFIGDGESGPILQRACELGVEGRVVVLGHRADASRYLTLADALVLPSRNEGLPLAILEALRAGVPVVASAIPEMIEAVGPELEQLLFTPEDAAGLARAFERATGTDGRHALAHASRDRFARLYGADQMIAGYEAWYSEVLGRAKTSSPA